MSQAPETNSVVENKIVDAAKSKPDGISNEEIQAHLSDIPAEVWTKVINKLLKSGYIILFY